MHDPVLDEALKRLAAEASTRFSSLVATGDQIPFDVAENDGESSHFYRYVPLTSRYIAAHLDELRSLPSWGPARGAVASSNVAAPYLESRGIPVPSEPERRAEEMLDVFIASLWEGTTEFSLDIARVERALASLEIESRDIREADVLVAPLIGFEMTPTEIELHGGIRIVQADSIQAPLEATSSEGTDRPAWQQAYLAMVPLGENSPARAVAGLKGLVEALRLFKDGSVGVGPFAFAPVGNDAWRRVETGAAPPRTGSYFLIESEVAGLDRLICRLAKVTGDSTGLGFARRRFRYGAERERPIDGLSDHLLAIRSALDGDGIIDAPLEAKAAALVTGDAENLLARERFNRAFDLEAALIRGDDEMTVGGESSTYIAAWIEDSTRLIVREALLGSFGSNLNVAAEETLIATGLQAGEGSISQLGSTAEWDAGLEPEEEFVAPEFPGEIAVGGPVGIDPPAGQPGAEIHVFRPRGAGEGESIDPEVEAGADPLFGSVPEFEPEPLPAIPADLEAPEPQRFEAMPEIERALGIEPGSERSTIEPDRTEFVAGRGAAGGVFDSDGYTGSDDGVDATRLLEPMPAEGEITVTARTEVGATLREDWLTSARGGATLDFPVIGGDVPGDAREGASHSLRNRRFFPDPGTTEWSVGEMRYRRRHG
ncbi:MAG: hypothetical protein M9938_06195 [Solirubrobacterales bacterium]|nr:hypothetical protein [Solirubrobacterales bacterium]